MPEDFEGDEAAYVSHLKERINTRSDKLRAKIEAELAEKASEGVPASMDDYEVNIPKYDNADFEIGIDEQNPIFGWFKAQAHELGMTQEGFDQAVAGYIDVWVQAQPKWEDAVKVLGENAEERHQRVDTWAHQTLDDETFKVFQTLPATAEMIQMFEKIMDSQGVASFNPDEPGNVGSMSDSELEALQGSDAYWNPGHPEHSETVKKYQAALNRKYKGTKQRASI